MKIWFFIALVLSVSLLLLEPIETFAHGKNPHDGGSDAGMNKLHALMPLLSQASAELESAIEKGDAAAAKVHSERILAAVPDLKKSRPHKNAKQRKKFVQLATKLDETVTLTVDLASKGDFAGAKTSFKKIEAICAACHVKFRD